MVKIGKEVCGVVFASLIITGIGDAADESKDWFGMPDGNGVNTELAITLEYISNVRGGVEKEDAFLGNIDLTAEINTGEVGLWEGGTIFLYGLGNFNSGKLPTDIIGDIQGTSNIEAPDTVKLYEAWYNHEFMDKRMAVLLGLYDYNSEFDVMEYAGVFPNSSFGIASQISQVGPSIFPTASLALRVKAKPYGDSYILATVYDGVPGDPDDDRWGSIKFEDGDGLFYGLELGMTPGEDSDSSYYKLALGGWYHSAEIEDFSGAEVDENGGFYIIAELLVYRESDDDQGLGLFAQFGNAREDRNRISQSVMAGLNYKGLIPCRDADVFGLGFSSAILSEDYRGSEAGAGLDNAETVIEAVYEASLSSRISMLLDAQYVVNPSSGPDIDNALQLGGRLKLVF